MHNWDYNNPSNGENEAWFIQFLSAKTSLTRINHINHSQIGGANGYVEE